MVIRFDGDQIDKLNVNNDAMEVEKILSSCN